MKKSKFIGIGLLALSVASCNHQAPKQRHTIYNSDSLAACNYYIREGDNVNYYQGDYNYPVWIYMDYFYSPSIGGISYRPGMVYHTTVRCTSSRGFSTSTGRSVGTGRSSFQSSSAGRSFNVSSGAVARGGFGHSGSASS